MSRLDLALKGIRVLVQERSGIVLDKDSNGLLESRLAPVAAQLGLDSLEALADKLRFDAGSLLDQVTNALTTNETLFFRDELSFRALRESILPRLISQLAAEQPLRIWCCASSSGQEPVSLALLLLEHFPEVVERGVSILATDIAGTMIERCQSGVYPDIELARGLNGQLRERYFQRQGGDWKVCDEVSRMIEYRLLNLTQPLPHFHYMDLVLCRYVLIYFDKSTKLTVLRQVRDVMRPDSVLLLGAETMQSPDFQMRGEGGYFYYEPAPRRTTLGA